MTRNIQRSISKLEGWVWKGKIPSRDQNSGTECRFFELHDKPIQDLELSDIRFLIGQNSGLTYLVPLAIEHLKSNIFIETEYYPGDMLTALLTINNNPNYWLEHPDEKEKLINLYVNQKEILLELDITHSITQKIKEAYKNFIALS